MFVLDVPVQVMPKSIPTMQSGCHAGLLLIPSIPYVAVAIRSVPSEVCLQSEESNCQMFRLGCLTAQPDLA